MPKHDVLRDSLTRTMAEYYENAHKCFPLSDVFFSGGKSAICHCTIEVVSAWRVLQPLLHAKKIYFEDLFQKLNILTDFQGLYLDTTSNDGFLPTHRRNIKMLFKYVSFPWYLSQETSGLPMC